MTRKEAIKGLKVLRRDFSGYKPNEEMFDIAIQALEQEPCEDKRTDKCTDERTGTHGCDCISRQAAIDAVYTSSGTGTALKALKALPSAQPFTTEQIQTMQELEAAQIEKAYELGKADRPKWIPCSERMPEEREWIGTEKFGTTISDMVLVTFEAQGERFVKPMRFQNGELGGMDKHTMDAICDEWKVVAWMPLPEPYKEESNE